MVNTGKRKFIFSFQERFLMEKWMAAINISRKTAQERLYSITGNVKNILRIIQMFDNQPESFQDEITVQFMNRLHEGEDWENLEELLLVCTALKEDLIKVSFFLAYRYLLFIRHSTRVSFRTHRATISLPSTWKPHTLSLL